MNPQEKAKELYLKYCPYDITYCDPLGREIEGYYERYAKLCATICIEQIVSELELYQDEGQPCFEYWTEVKQELEKL